MLFVAVNVALQNIDQPMVTDPPADWTINPLGTINVYAGLAAMIATVPGNIPANTTMLVAAARPVAGGVSFMKTFVQLGYALTGTQGLDITAAYLAQFGAPAVGQRIFFRLTPVNEDGLTGSPVILFAQVGAAVVIPTPVATSASTGVLTATWTGGGSYDAWAFDVDNPLLPPVAIGDSGAGVSPGNIPGLTSGNLYKTRLTDGTNWSPASNSIAAM